MSEQELNTPEAVANALGGQSAEENKSDGAQPVNPLPFDMTKLTREQLQLLKSMLGATPDSTAKKNRKPTIRLREIDGRVVVDFKNAHLALVDDLVAMRKVERHMLPVKFFGDKEFSSILYSTFINAKQVALEVVSVDTKVVETEEGETTSRETGAPVIMVSKATKSVFTVVLPTGEEVKIEDRVANG